MFDVSQTDPTDPEQPSAALTQTLTGGDPLGILAAVSDYLAADGWAVEREHLTGGRRGYTDGPPGRHRHRRRARPGRQDRPARGRPRDPAHRPAAGEYHQHRGTYETEAESVAYVVAGILGLDTSAYTIGYVAGWSDADVDLIRSTAANVLRAAHQLAAAITTDPPNPRPPDTHPVPGATVS
ncbi:hypothetical protein ACFFL4_18815, partial [Cellulomonas denverensis]